MKLSEDMGLMFLEETTSPDNNVAKNLDVYDKNGIFYVEFEAPVHSFDVMNRNSRMYRAKNIMECLDTERIQTFLKNGGWYGEMNHPTPEYKNQPLSPERIQDIKMDNTSHRMLNPHLESNLLVSKIQSDAGADAGMNLARNMVQGFNPAFSCRAIASLVLESGKPVVHARKVITYDWVLYQSHREAEKDQSSPTAFVSKSPAYMTESAIDADNCIMIPLTEILESVGKTDPNPQVIMESFDLSLNDIRGITPDRKHLIIKDENNTIYCNINPESRNKINEFLRSF
jgi:hypothetical protein